MGLQRSIRKMVLINAIKARQIFDSRGNPTVEVDLTTNLGVFRAAVPSGASTGIYEALEMRDKIKSEYHGKGVKQAIANVNGPIAGILVGKDLEIANQEAMDKMLLDLDGTANKYDLDFKNADAGDVNDKSRYVSPTELADIYCGFIDKYPICSIEDPFDQDDWDGYVHFTERVGTNTQVVGDDLLVTNPSRIQTGIDKKACNALLLKVNQIGTLTESIEAAKMSLKEGWGVMVSHRSGETEDSFIADLVVGLQTGQIKTGAPCRSERLSKYNQLLRIEEDLGENAVYAGQNWRKPANAL